MRRISLFAVVTVLCLTAGRKYPDGWQFLPLPAEDAYATNRFGRSWLEPVYSGYLIVSNRYIEAPYIVEQRGFVIFVNNERIEDGTDIRLVSPIPSPPSVTNDPGKIIGLSKASTLFDLFGNPTYRAKQEYWNNVKLYGETRFQTTLALLRTLPCVSNVVDLKAKAFDGSQIQVWDYQGNSLLVSLQTAPREPVRTATDPETYGHIVAALGARHLDLTQSYVKNSVNGGFPGGLGPMRDTNAWIAVFQALASDLTVSQKVAQIRVTGKFRSLEDFQLQEILPMNGFVASPQLWQRLSGDMSWTNDAPARLLALTNGWQRILPAFMRTQTVAAATVATVAKSDSDTTTATVVAQVASAQRTSYAAVSPRETVVPRDKDRNWTTPVAIALSIILILLLFLTRHLFRKWNRDHSQ